MCPPSLLAEVVGKKMDPDGTHTSSSQRHVFPHILILYLHGQNVKSNWSLPVLMSCGIFPEEGTACDEVRTHEIV